MTEGLLSLKVKKPILTDQLFFGAPGGNRKRNAAAIPTLED